MVKSQRSALNKRLKLPNCGTVGAEKTFDGDVKCIEIEKNNEREIVVKEKKGRFVMILKSFLLSNLLSLHLMHENNKFRSES